MCHGAFPKSTDFFDADYLKQVKNKIEASQLASNSRQYPVPVNGTVEERMQEYRGDRSKICVYDEFYQQATFLHVSEKFRTLVPFYSMTFFQDWRHDLWLKRVIRDHLRYKDELQCAAARVVEHIQHQALLHDPTSMGVFDAIHVRREAEFHRQMHTALFSARDLYAETSKILPEGSTVFVATDINNKEYFGYLQNHP